MIWQARVRSMKFAQSESLPWEPEIVPGPDVENRETLLTLAKMSNDAYVERPGEPYWYELDKNWNDVSTSFRTVLGVPLGSKC